MRRVIFALFAGIVATLAQAADDVLIDDFESGRFDTWTVDGTAFGKGPLAIEGLDSPRAKSPSPADWETIYCPGRQGKYVAHSAPDRNHGPQGKLTSQPFAINRQALKFLIGGGSTPATRIDLLVDGKVVRSASGEDVHGVAERVWDVAEFKGRQGVLQIVDASSGSWGCIVVDRIVLSDTLTAPPWVGDPKDFLTLRPVQQMAGAAWPDNWVKDPNAKLLFMGDSITASWDANAFKKFCVNRSYVNLGRNMEQVAHLLWRLDHINCDGAQAKLIVLMIGSNDGACNFSSQDVAAGVGAVVAKLRTKLPQAKVLVMSILPRGDRPKDKQLAFTQINPLIAKLADRKNVFYLDICEKYFGGNDRVNPALLGDLVHPTGKGFEVWAEAMEPIFKELLDGAASARSLTLAARGQAAAYAIVRPADGSASQIYAAEELQKFTEQMTGVKLPILTDDGPLPERAILLGATRHSAALLGGPVDLKALGDDGFRLKTCPPHLLIVGGAARGTLNGVYEMLERCGGCRWFSSWHSVIPQLAALSIPGIDETQRPAFAMREPYWFDMFNGDFAARNKANGAAMRLEDKHGGGIRFGTGCMVHTFKTLVPPEEFFAAHPEYFSEIGGKRVKDLSQLCLTNPQVLRIVTDRVLERIRQDPGAKLFSVSQNDCLNFCTCASCKVVDTREGTPAGTMIAFVNQVAEAVEKEFPNVWIETLAYQYTRTPPKTIRPRHNVVVRLCSIECEFSKPFDLSAAEQNRKFVAEMDRWSAMTEKLHIWDYVTNFRDYLGPFPNVLALQGNIRFFRDHHVVGVFEEGAYQGRHGDFAELKAWLLAKWLWNPDLPAEPLLKDFFAGYYGAAAPQVRRYFDEVHAFYQKPGASLSIYDDVLRQPPVTAGFYAHAVDLWRQAEAAVKDSPAHSYNVRMGAIPALFAHLSRLPAGANEERRTLAADLLARFNEAKDIWISESPAIHKNTLEQWAHWSQP